MDDDFDAYTLETRLPLTETAETVNHIARTTSWAPTSPPLDEDFDAWTYTNTAGPVTGTGTLYEDDHYHPDSEDDEDYPRSGRSGERGTEGYEGSESQGGVNHRLRVRSGRKLGRKYSLTLSASKASGSGLFHNGNGYHRNTEQNGHAAKPQYDTLGHKNVDYYGVHEMPSSTGNNGWHLDGKGVNEFGGLSLMSSASRREGTGQGHWQVARSHTGTSKNRNEKGKVHGEGSRKKDNTRARRRSDHIQQTISRQGPVAHDYEVVENQVLEDGPERTVTISTWREKVANEARRSEVEMSVYFLNADDYVMDPGIDERKEEFRDSLKGQGGSRKGKGKQRDLLNDGWTRSEPVYYRNTSPIRPQTPWPPATNLADVDGEMSERANTPERRDRSWIRRSSYTEWMDREYVEPRTSTPIRHRKGRNGIRNPEESLHINGKLSNGTTHGIGSNPKDTINGTGHPSESNLTISSMQVASTPALEALLSSCEPSLLYLAPVLVSLGIRTKEHMKAVGRLREETRNREVREEALKRGMTIMEWAILLDKLQQNG
ncbi:hypothetical protein J3R30DRAFT_3707951 [Lentinula aciculospora]|uniref:Uncharacterized protein n=1 Tax=Lentinula aciculospora TaxID=153920 RepID=A0A9W9DJX3_9AGAR|nr:hypothetical protein J3R30DRAFT_3707951 [Lentinula aciculospora]